MGFVGRDGREYVVEGVGLGKSHFLDGSRVYEESSPTELWYLEMENLSGALSSCFQCACGQLTNVGFSAWTTFKGPRSDSNLSRSRVVSTRRQRIAFAGSNHDEQTEILLEFDFCEQYPNIASRRSGFPRTACMVIAGGECRAAG